MNEALDYLHSYSVYNLGHLNIPLIRPQSSYTIGHYCIKSLSPDTNTLTHNGKPIHTFRHSIDVRKLWSLINIRHDDEFLVTQVCPRICHPSIPDAHYFNYRDPLGHMVGTIKRVAHQPVVKLTRDHPLLKEFGKFVWTWIKSHYVPLDYIEINHSNLDELWLDGSKYNLNEKRRFHDQLQAFIDDGPGKGFYTCNSFIKKELMSELKTPRIINSRSDQFKAVFAPATKLIELQVCHNSHFIKGQNKHEFIHRLLEVQSLCSEPHIYETDYSSFEGSFDHLLMLECEYKLLTYMLRNNPQLHNIIKRLYKQNNLLIYQDRSGVTAKSTVKGSRMSGEMWTSMCNGFTNQMLFEFCVSKSSALNKEYDYVVEGDDGFLCTSFNLDTSPISNLGFQLKCEAVSDINEMSFCGICMHDNHFVPDVATTLMKLPYTFDVSAKHSKRRRLELARAKAVSLLYESQGVPILQPLAFRILKLTEGAQINMKDFDWWYANYMLPTELPTKFDHLEECITQSMRQFIEDKFSISVADQLSIELAIENFSLTTIFMT